MDGLPSSALPVGLGALAETTQRTLASRISCVGVGLHSGHRAHLTLNPASAGHGIVFRRTDLAGAPTIPATYDNVSETRLSTVLAHPDAPDIRVGTVEHVMAALAGLGISNALIDVDGPEVPILDGSSRDLVFLIECAGIVAQNEPATVIEVARTVRVTQGEAFAELRPFPLGLDLSLSIDFQAAAIGRQALSLRLSPGAFRSDIAGARTFADVRDIEALRAAGLARGGSLDNAVVVDGADVLNPGGLRHRDEFVRHKLLDAIGDLALAGGVLRGRFIGHCSGHGLNNRLLRALFADPTAWRTVQARPWESLAA